MPMARRINCLCHSSCGGSTASPKRKISQMVSQTASRRLNLRESGSKMGRAGATQLPSNRRKGSRVNWRAASPPAERAGSGQRSHRVFQLRTHRNLAAIESPEHATHWLRKVAVQRSIDESRRRNRRPQVSLADVAEPAAIAPARDPLLAETLHRLVASLPESPRMVMILRYQEDLDP